MFNKEFYVIRTSTEAIGGEIDIVIAMENMEREPSIGDLKEHPDGRKVPTLRIDGLNMLEKSCKFTYFIRRTAMM